MKRLILLMLASIPMVACTTMGTDRSGLEVLADYDAVMIEPVTVEFDKDWAPKLSNSRLPMSQRDIDDIRTQLEVTFNEEFRGTLEQANVKVTEQPGRGVLLIKPQLHDVWLYAPTPESMFGSVFIRRVGSMQFQAGLSDSLTGEELVVMQAEVGGHSGYLHATSKVHNRSMLQQIFQRWGRIVADDLLWERDRD